MSNFLWFLATCSCARPVPFALRENLAPDTGYKTRPKPVRRWQVAQIGQLWQYAASPHRWLADQDRQPVLLELIDDHSRLIPAARLYPRETLLAHFDLLSGAFLHFGLPLALYVDYHSFFFTHTPEAFTQLGAALHFYEVSLRFAPTPQAKGKIERAHGATSGDPRHPLPAPRRFRFGFAPSATQRHPPHHPPTLGNPDLTTPISPVLL